MELDPEDGKLLVGEPHDQPVLGLRRDRQAIRQGRAGDHQGMIAGGVERRGQPLEDAAAVMIDSADLTVHGKGSAFDAPAEGLTDGLMAEANA